MPRVTDTRQRVRELAEKLAREGTEPSAALIRQLLGKGSPNTIVEELKSWRESRAVPAPAPTAQIGSPKLLERLGLEDLAAHLEQVRKVSAEQRELVASIATDRALISKLLETLTSQHAQISSLVEQLQSERLTTAAHLESMQARFDGLHKYMLKSIDDAREETRVWKERTRLAKEEADTWRFGVQSRMEALATRNAQLEGMVEALKGTKAPSPPPAAPAVAFKETWPND